MLRSLSSTRRSECHLTARDRATASASRPTVATGRGSAIITARNPIDIARKALSEAKTLMYDTVILDTAGRLHIDDELMKELHTIRDDARRGVLPHGRLMELVSACSRVEGRRRRTDAVQATSR